MEGHDPHIVPNCSGETRPTENTVPVSIKRQPSYDCCWPLSWPTTGNGVPTAYLHSPVSVTVGRRVPRLPSCIYNIQCSCCPHCEDSAQAINKTNCCAATPHPVCTYCRQKQGKLLMPPEPFCIVSSSERHNQGKKVLTL